MGGDTYKYIVFTSWESEVEPRFDEEMMYYIVYQLEQ